MAFEFRSAPGGALQPRPHYQPATPTAFAAMSFFTAAGPAAATAPAPAPVGQPGAAFRRLDRLAPLALSTPALVLGRIWHLHGAAHSIGDAALMGALSLATAVVGCASSAGAVVTGTALGLAGGLAASAVAGYAASLWPGLVLWALGTVAGYAVAWRGWRAEARQESERQDKREARELESATATQVAMIEARRDVAVAMIGAERDVRVAEIYSEREQAFAARYGLSTSVPPIDPQLLRRSPETTAALGAPKMRVEHGVYDYEAESA